MKAIAKIVLTIRKAVYITFGAFDRMVLSSKNSVFIISYHSIDSDSWRFSIDEKEIKKQISYFKKHFDIISLKTLESYLQGKEKITKPSVILTFDDGYKDILKLRFFLKKEQIKPAVFILADTKHPNRDEM